jgi:diguanylate cyclase (GGDEF)-like protein
MLPPLAAADTHYARLSDGATMTHTLDPHSFALIDDGGGDSRALSETLLALTEQIAMALDCSECCIYEYIPERGALRAQAIWSLQLNDIDRAWIGKENHLADIPDFHHVITKREILVSYPDDKVDAETSGPESMAFWGELAALWAPIVSGDDVLGILELTEKRRRREFNAEDVALVRRMSGLAALALKNAGESRATQARNRQLTALIDSSRAMTSTLDLDEVLDVVCRQAARALDTTSSYIYEYDAEANATVWLAHFQRDPSHDFEEPLGTVYPLEGLPQDRQVIVQRHPVQVRVDDPGIDPLVRERLLHREETASLMVPLIVGDNVVGALEVSETGDARLFTEDETALCNALGEQAAVAIRNAQLYRQLQEQKAVIERQAITDGLTGLSNHRHFFERLRAEAARARRYGFPLTVLMLDIDDFKSVNDRFGHPTGDSVLFSVAQILRAQLRENVDATARYGGEEFAMILPHTGGACHTEAAAGALATAERLREAIAQAELHVAGTAALAHITVSVGAATLTGGAIDAEELLSQADRALYAAKRSGKDQVSVYCPAAVGAGPREEHFTERQTLSPRQ